MDLLETVAKDLGFEFHLYVVQDELFGGKVANKNFSMENNFGVYQRDEHEFNQQRTVGGRYYDMSPNIRRPFKVFKENDDIYDKRQYLNHERRLLWNREKHFMSESRAVSAKWNGIIGDLIAGVADMSFAPLSISK